MSDTSDQPLVQSAQQRLPALGRTTRWKRSRSVRGLVERTERSAAEAREYNKTISAEDQEAFYLAGMNAIAEKVWHLARNKHSNPEELRIYLELFLKHRDQEIKRKKTDLMLRHLELLESKRKILEEAAKDRGLSDAQFFGKIREVFFPSSNGHDAAQILAATGRPPKLIENGENSFTS